MSLTRALIRWAYRAARPLAAMAARALPQRCNPGLRAYGIVTDLGLAPGRETFAAAVLESFLRSLLLQKHLASLDPAGLHDFATRYVVFEGPMAPPRLFEESRPLIFATPHYGAPLAALVVSAQLLRGRRTLNVFYDKRHHGERLQIFFARAGIRTHGQLSGLSGIRTSLRALERGECVAILPDAFDDIAQTLVVPFFDRLLRAASGTAFLALRSGALIVPTFATPEKRFGLRVLAGEPIEPARAGSLDETQAIFLLTRLLFARIEEQLRFAPEHWRNWEALPQVSTPLGLRSELNDSQLLIALEARLRALPPALQSIPELELLLS
jgi:lauroyl/myristoyl acyltransferase